jgi:hypothetical protein
MGRKPRAREADWKRKRLMALIQNFHTSVVNAL